MRNGKLSAKRNRPADKVRKASNVSDLGRGKLFLSQGRVEEAQRHLEQAVRREPCNPEAYQLLASAYASQGAYGKAEEQLKHLIGRHPQHVEAYRALAEVKLASGDPDAAIENYQKALFLEKGDARLHNDLGAVLFAVGRFSEAEKHLEAALALRHEYPDAIHNLGMVHLKQENVEKARDLLERLIVVEPGKQETLQQLGLLNLKLGNPKEAMEHFHAAITLMPDAVEPKYWLGIAYYSAHELDSAAKIFRECIAQEPEYYPASCALAACLTKAGKQTEAVKTWDRVLALAPASSFQPVRHSTPTVHPFELVHLPNPELQESGRTETVELSVVIPVCNEQDNIQPLWHGLKPVLERLGRTHEVIFIDDGSTDETLTLLRELAERAATVRIVSFRRNYGQTAALSAGFDLARGEIVVTMDGDLQNDPEDIPMLLQKLADGYDLVSGWRQDRKDKLFSRRLPSILANRLIARITGVKLHDYGCSLKAYKRGVIKNIRLYGEMHRFIPAVVSWLGAKIVEVPVKHHARIHGQTKYGLSRTTRVILDLINVKFLLSYLTRPMQYFGKLGIMSIGAAIIFGVLLTIGAIVFPDLFSTNTVLLSTVLFTLVGVQFITIGLLAEIVIRTYHESQRRPIYVVKEIIGEVGEEVAP